VEKLITSVHESTCFVDSTVDKKIVRFSFWIRLRAPPGGCRNLLRTFRKGGRGWERTEDSHGEVTHRSRR
jgi:hypothetical protein